MSINWNPGDCLKLKQPAYGTQGTLYQNIIYELINLSTNNNYAVVKEYNQSSSSNDDNDNDDESHSLDILSQTPSQSLLDEDEDEDEDDISLTADTYEITTELYENNYYKDEDTNEIYFPTSYLIKIDCETHIFISDLPILKASTKKASTKKASTKKASTKKALTKKAVKEKASIKKTPTYEVISTLFENANDNFLMTEDRTKFIMSETGNRRIPMFETVKILEREEDYSLVSSIDDNTKIYKIPNNNLTPFVSIIGQIFNIDDDTYTIKSKDIENPNYFIVINNKTGEYLRIQEEVLTRSSSSKLSNFYSAVLSETTTTIDEIKSECPEISDDIRDVYCQTKSNFETVQTGDKSDKKFYKKDNENCFIKYIFDLSPDTIYIDKFMCSGELKGTGRDLFCDFLCYVVKQYPDIKYISLIAQPYYMSVVDPSPNLIKILQKMLNNFYRSLGFKKINNNNYFIGCLSELFEPCLNKITFTHQDEEYERYLNDNLNIRNISISLSSFNNEELLKSKTKGGHKKSKKRKSKKRKSKKRKSKSKKRKRKSNFL
jgi:hypothetical protein